MPCTESTRRSPPGLWALPAVALLLVACGAPQRAPVPAPAPPATPTPASPAPATPATPAPAPVPTPTPPAIKPPAPVAPAPPAAPTRPAPGAAAPAAPATPQPQARRHVPLGPPAAARNWDEFKQQAARRLVQSNPDGTYLGSAPDNLLAIPVLEVELNADGSVRRVQVLRHPKQATDTTQMAIDAVHRAAPYGAMGRLPLPWKWVEVFLFDDDRRFKPRELDK